MPPLSPCLARLPPLVARSSTRCCPSPALLAYLRAGLQAPQLSSTSTGHKTHFSTTAATHGTDKGSGFPWRRRRASPGSRWARMLWRLRVLLVGRRAAVGAPARSSAASVSDQTEDGPHVGAGDASSPSLIASLAAAAAAGKGKAKAGNELKLRCTEFDKQGRVTLVSGEFKKSELIAKVTLPPNPSQFGG
jgi:hypothetical protein